ncbi:MAG: hypothetical protein IJW86_00995 [Clostridia bacterium]|nr:hypothetical protein [Clostridia bacterium]
MNNHISRPDMILPAAEIVADPFLPCSRSKTAEHKKRFQCGENSQKSLKNKENES